MIKVTTTPGVAPALPSTVIANMSNGRTELVNVTWANVTPSQYGSEGTFTVSGAIANTTVLAMVNVTVTPAALSFPGENGIDYNLPDGIAGTAYTANIIATGGTPPYNYTLEYPNSLPAGLTMGTDGTISGIPIQDWTETQGMPIGGVADIFTVNVTDSATPTARTVSNKCVLTVRPALGSIPLMFWGPQTCQCYPVVGTPCNCLVTCVYGGTPPYSVALASGSSLPAGLTMGTDGTISGTPTVSGTASFTLIATDSTKPTAETVSAPFNFTVLPALSLPSTTLADGTVGTAYTASISATGGTSLPYSYALASGSSLPTGLTMGTDGTISGTPTASGTTSFTVNVTDIALQTGQTATASQTFSITVLAGNKVTVPVLP
ncbi:S-layer domain protein (fragment) [Candidatus Desulfosporosinus infrequens]|uniref:S-layer domain protein n=1 Tax=Candidatus Desulfosporosinus infrequens TaxID=2043169 RepID=A0A2U3LAJ0_9FIRM